MDNHTTPPRTDMSRPTLTRGALLRWAGRGAGAALAASALASAPTLTIATAASAATRRSTMQAQTKPTVVLVHGAFADGSSWSKVIPLLQAAGHGVVAVQLDMASLADDIARTRGVLAAQDGPTVLVGHSYGGAVITGAGADEPRVISLVYVAAYAPDEGESVFEAVAAFPNPSGTAHLIPDYRKGFVRLDPAAYPTSFIQDVDPVDARARAVAQRASAGVAFTTKLGTPAWRQRPSWYLISEDDRMINPDAERAMAKRMGATTTTIRGSSHASLVSHPAEVARAIESAALAGVKR